MKHIKIFRTTIILGSFLLCLGCKKNYIVGGTTQNVNVYANTTTYDVLKSNPLFDTLVQLIDTAGLKDKINEQGVTFFAPSDFAIYNYLYIRTLDLQNSVDQNAKFDLDSMFYYLRNNINGTKDSLLMYLVHQPLYYDALTSTGAIYPSELQGNNVAVSYEETSSPFLGYTSQVSLRPKVVYFTQLWYPYDLSESNPASDIPTDIGVRTLCTTSGIITQTGIMHVLTNSHTLFFYNTKQ